MLELHKPVWASLRNCVTPFATNPANRKLDFGPPGSETPASSYLRTDSKRHCAVSAWFPARSASPLQKTALSLSTSLLPLSEMHSWSSWPVSASAPLWIWSLNQNHLAKPILVIRFWPKVVSPHTNLKMPKCWMCSNVQCVFHRPLTLLIFFGWPFNGEY